MRVLITGSAGATGTEMLAYLRSIGEAEVIGTARDDCDLTDYAATVSMVRRADPQAVIHLAAKANVAQSFLHSRTFMENNIIGTDNLLRAIYTLKIHPRVLMVSSCEVYGDIPFPVDERAGHAPANPYAVSKCGQEHLGMMAWRIYRLPVIISRLFNTINPRREDLFSSAFARQVARIEARKQATLFHGNLDTSRCVMDVRDVVSAYWHLLKRGEPGEAYNVGTNQETSVREFLNLLTSKAKCVIPRAVDDSLMRPLDIRKQVPYLTKFNALGWKARYTLSDSIEYLLAYWREREVA